jgi:hypothetical protein
MGQFGDASRKDQQAGLSVRHALADCTNRNKINEKTVAPEVKRWLKVHEAKRQQS